MKQLLLSTVILFGTLSSINAADAGEFKGEDDARGAIELAAVATVPTADYLGDLRLAFDRLDAGEYELETLADIRRAILIGEGRTHEEINLFEERHASLKNTIIKCLDEMTHYRPFVCADVLTPQNIVFVLTCLTINGILIGAGNLYPALPPMAGASMIMVANLLVLVSVLYVKEYELGL